MNRTKLTALLRRSAINPGVSTRFCPDDETVAGFVDDNLDAATRHSVTQHLYDCSACAHRVGQVVRFLREDEVSTQAAAHRGSRWRQGALPWATAATVLIMLGWLSVPSTIPEHEYVDTRNLAYGPVAPEILAPTSGIFASDGATYIRWTEVPGAADYDVVIVTDIGDVVVSKRVDEPRLLIGNDLGLEPGRDYYVRVDAHLADEQSIRSEHIPLQVLER